MDSPLRKLLWMVVAIAAMVLLAPIAASAHEGHRSGPEPGVHAAGHSQHAAADHGLAMRGEQTTAQGDNVGGADQDGLCTAGCCFGMGCCGGTIVSATPALDPPSGAPARVEHTPPPLSSAGQTSLFEPPTTLA